MERSPRYITKGQKQGEKQNKSPLCEWKKPKYTKKGCVCVCVTFLFGIHKKVLVVITFGTDMVTNGSFFF